MQPPASLPACVWRAHELGGTGQAGHPSGFASLDAQLPGSGWPSGMLTELISREPGTGELRLLVPLLRQLSQAQRLIILLAPPHIPYAPALQSHGIDINRLLIVQAPNAADRLWAVEKSLKSGSFGCLLAWLPQERTRPEHLRRLQLAAQAAQGPVFLFRPLAAQFEAFPRAAAAAAAASPRAAALGAGAQAARPGAGAADAAEPATADDHHPAASPPGQPVGNRCACRWPGHRAHRCRAACAAPTTSHAQLTLPRA